MAPFDELSEESDPFGPTVGDMIKNLRAKQPRLHAKPLPADHNAKTARATESIDQHMVEIIAAMYETIEINQQAQEAAARTERFARTMAWSSLGVAVASLTAAFVAIFVTH